MNISTPSTTANPELSSVLQQAITEDTANGLVNPLSLLKHDSEAITTTAQVIVDDLMKNNAAFREAVGYPALPSIAKKDPLAVDKNSWNLPKTGVVNTTGALQRINARTGETGVTATKDSKGMLTLSNVGSNVAAANKTFTANAQAGKNPLQMDSLMSQLRAAGTTAEASVIMDNIRTTVTSEQVKINTEALNFASGKLGIPSMEQTLSQSEMNDRASPSWFPGIGDSPGTKGIRTQLQLLRGQANEQANVFLQTNLASGMLKNSLLSAGEELKRLDKKESASDRRTELSTARKEEREAIDDENVAAVVRTLPPAYASYLKILNPGLTVDTESDVTKKAFSLEVKSLTKNGGNNPRMTAIKAAAQQSGNELIGLSVEGNLDAKTLLRASEKTKNPALSDDQFNEKLRKITSLADSNEFVKTYITDKYGPGKANSEDAKKDTMRLNAAKLSGTAEEKNTARRERIGVAISLERKNATGNYMKDVSSWGSNDTAFRKAYVETMQKRGNADFGTVMESYMGLSTGAEAFQKGQALTGIAKEAFARGGNSVFGKPDESAAMSMISERVRVSGIGKAITDILDIQIPISPFLSPLVPMGVAGMEMLNRGIGSFTPKNDPTTGLPYPK